MAESKTARQWGGRFAGDTAEVTRRLNDSLPFDRRLWREDIAGSIAHATMLGRTGILGEDESARIVEALREIESGLEAGTIELPEDAEDIHTAVEELLRRSIGPLAGKLHTARSRNDQVATDARLYLRRVVDELAAGLHALQSALVDGAEREADTVLAGCTHLQHAQPILLSHHLLAYFWMFQRDRERLRDARRRLNQLPLGAGALAGTTFPIDRRLVAELLGFDGVVPNSLDAVSDRDFAIEFLAAAAIVAVHLSRLAEELILWNSPEFGYVELDDSVTTGSSIMPQKKNPDVAELARGKAGRVFGDLMALLTVMKGLPLAYNKDMQEDKEPVFDAADTLLALLPAVERMVRTARFRRDRMAQAMRGDFSTATDLADLLVRRGFTFREAHRIVGQVVRDCLTRGIGLEDLTEADLERLTPGIGADALAAVTVQASLSARRCEGGSAPDAVREQLRAARALIAPEGPG